MNHWQESGDPSRMSRYQVELAQLRIRENDDLERVIMNVCPDCHHPIEADDLFCSRCGAAIGVEESAVIVASRVRSDLAGTALGSLEKILQADASDAGRLVLAAFERICDGETDDALLASESAVTMNPGLWTAHLLAGVSRNQRGETEQAEAHLQDALRSEPNAIHFKASLERMIAAKSPKRIKISSARLSSLSPGRWAAISGGTVLLLGLIWISLSASRNGRSGRYERNYGAQVPVPVRSLSNQPADQQGFTANPTPTRAVNPPTYAPMTAPAQPASNYYARQSAPPPINPYDADPDRKIASRLATGIRESVSSDSNSALLPLPPAQPDLSGAPELKDPNARLAKRADLAAAPSDPTPWLKKAAPKKPPETGASLLSGKLVGRASVGVDPGTRKNLPAPSDAVTSSSSVRQSPPTVVRSDSPDASDAQRNRPTGRQLQAEARRYQYQGKWAEAKQAYQAAIDAYQDEINNGRNPKQAEYGMAASQAALDLLDSSR